MRGTLQFVLEVAKVVIIALVIVVPLRAFVFQPFLVKGDSMEPNFHTGDYLIVDELSYRFRDPERGEVIILKFPQDPSQRFIKRIIGLPGETIEIQDGKVVVYKQDSEPFVLDETMYLPSPLETGGSTKWELKEDQYFVLGDNRSRSSDSRVWGPLSEELIIGRSFIRVFSFNVFASE